MENNTPTDNAIIPDHQDRQLSLPQEMIQRGLELAARVEQGIQPLPEKRAGQEYTVRCRLEMMAWTQEGDGSYILGHRSDPSPISLFISFCLWNRRAYLSPAPASIRGLPAWRAMRIASVC